VHSMPYGLWCAVFIGQSIEFSLAGDTQSQFQRGERKEEIERQGKEDMQYGSVTFYFLSS
jgi:hypothetical protein